MVTKVLFPVAIFFGAVLAVSWQAQVGVTVYYEALCPDSVTFIVKQLYPTLQHENLAKYIDLKLIPYGKALQTYTDAWKFTCHHGPNECYGNLIQACALSILPRNQSSPVGYSKVTVGFINCLMAQVNRDATPFAYPTQQCAVANNINNVSEIEKCANSTEGATALSELGHLTAALKPELKSVPTIVFENVYTQADQDLAITNFQKALCGHIKDKENVAECQSNGATRSSFSARILMSVCVLLGYTFQNVL